ncbi:MAG: CBS domain-containing protein [Anaerolineae bacterium]|nr:CBS domain-containing protein [Anaerolineae bacterium]
MLVGERMKKDPITITVDSGISEALKMMREYRVRRFPVMDRKGKMVGIVSEKDLLYASPSPATSLDTFELHYLLAKMTVEQFMARPVITVTEDTPIEEAARIMADNKIGGLPVMRGDQLVGIITETTLFKIFLELMGARQRGVRLTLQVPNVKGELAKITAAITSLGGNILALGTFHGDEPSTSILTIKVDGVEQGRLVGAMKEMGAEIMDARMA